MKSASERSGRRVAFFLATGLLFLFNGPADSASGAPVADSRVLSMRERLENTNVESVQFDSASLESALEFLAGKVEGLQFVVLNDGKGDGGGIGSKPVTLSLRSVPAATVLSYLCRLAGCQYEVEREAVMVGTGAAIAEVLTARAARPQVKAASAPMKILQSVQLDSVELNEVDLATALHYLRRVVAESTGGVAPNFVIVEHQTDSKVESPASRVVSLDLEKVAASTAFGYLIDLSGLSYRTDGKAIAVGPLEQVAYSPAHRLAGGSAIQRQMAATQIAEVRFDGISLAEALEGVRFYSRQGNAAGLNVIDRARELENVPPVQLHLDRVSLADLVSYIAEQTGTRARIEQMALVIEADPSLAQRAAAKQAEQVAKSGGAGAVPVAPNGTSTTVGKGKPVSNENKKPDEGLRFD